MPAVLVVDDEADLVTTYERALRRLGYRIIPAGTRQAGLQALRSERLALVVADLRLPDGDGLDIVRAAREAPGPPPVIVVTGFASAAGQQAALEAGARAFLAKPFSVQALLETVRQVVGDARPHP
jgi:DNA-binding response OmpR family regulator